MTNAAPPPVRTVESFDGVPLALYEFGNRAERPPVMLLHGFAASINNNFVFPKLVDALVKSGHHVYGFDARGHGQSGKPHDAKAYADDAMSKDVSAVLDELRLESCHLVGYSMGGFTAFRTVARGEDRVRSLVLGGVGARLIGGRAATRPQALAAAMRAPSADAIDDETARGFRQFAERTGADLEALAAMQEAAGRAEPADPKAIGVPTLVVLGQDDALATDADKLTRAIPDAKLVMTPGDHLSVVGQRAFHTAITDFLAAVS